MIEIDCENLGTIWSYDSGRSENLRFPALLIQIFTQDFDHFWNRRCGPYRRTRGFQESPQLIPGCFLKFFSGLQVDFHDPKISVQIPEENSPDCQSHEEFEISITWFCRDDISSLPSFQIQTMACEEVSSARNSVPSQKQSASSIIIYEEDIWSVSWISMNVIYDQESCPEIFGLWKSTWKPLINFKNIQGWAGVTPGSFWYAGTAHSVDFKIGQNLG